MALGQPPQLEKQERRRQHAARLDRAVDAYVAALERRSPNRAKMTGSLLRRELVAPLKGATDLASLDRRTLAARIAAVEESGRKGLAAELRTRASTFLNWACDTGLIGSNPLAGMRRPRATHAEEDARHGRALTAVEIAALWRAAGATGEAHYAAYLRALLFTGCRRTELAEARWDWIKDRDGQPVLVIPAGSTKNNQEHLVPLPGPLLAVLSALPRRADSALIFPGRGGKRMSGWSKRWARVVAEARSYGLLGRVTMHDLRRTARSWWSELRIAEPVAELMINHRPRKSLKGRYDRAERWAERVQAAAAWADKLLDLTRPEDGIDTAAVVARVPATAGHVGAVGA